MPHVFQRREDYQPTKNAVRQSVPAIQSELPQVRFLQAAGDRRVRRRIRRSKSFFVLPAMSRARSHANLLNQILLNWGGAYQFHAFVSHVVECAIYRTPFRDRADKDCLARIQKSSVAQPPIIVIWWNNERHPIMNPCDGIARRRGQNDKAMFLRVQINLVFRFLLPQSGEAKGFVVRQSKSDWRLVGSPLVKSISGNEATLIQMAVECCSCGNCLGLRVD